MVLLIIDAQTQIMTDRLYSFEAFKDNVRELIGFARECQIEVVYVVHDDGVGSDLTPGKEGFEVYHEFSPQKNEKTFLKTVNSPFKESGLLYYLISKNINSIIVAGLQTDYCIDATVKCGFEHGFDMIVPALCNTTTDNAFISGEISYGYYNNFIWKNRYASCMSINDCKRRMKNSKTLFV